MGSPRLARLLRPGHNHKLVQERDNPQLPFLLPAAVRLFRIGDLGGDKPLGPIGSLQRAVLAARVPGPPGKVILKLGSLHWSEDHKQLSTFLLRQLEN